MSKTKTNWCEATTNISKAMMNLVSCLENDKNAWLEIQKNGEQDYPILMKNPELENPFNWKSSYGTLRNNSDFINKKWFNDTEKDLTLNYTSCFGEKEAIEIYQKNGTVTKNLTKNMGICHPVKNKDLNKLRNDGYEYGSWIYSWVPKNGIPYKIPKNIDKVFVVCNDDKPLNKKQSLLRASGFLKGYAETL